MKHLTALTLFCSILILNLGTAQERKSAPPDPAPSKQRALYSVQNGDAVLLAEVVGGHFKGDATIIAAPAGSGNAVLVSGSSATVPEVLKLLEQLDRKSRTVEVVVTLVEVPTKDWKEAEVKADELVKAGQQIKLTAVEGQQVSTQSGGSKPFISGNSPVAPGGFGKGGVSQKSISYHNVGTTVRMTARIGSGDAISLDLSVQDSRVRAPDPGDETGAPAIESNTLTTKLSVPPGKVVFAQTIKTEGKSGGNVTVILVTARVTPIDPTPPKRR